MFEHKETYIHLLAKEVLKRWLDTSATKRTRTHFDLFSYTPNRKSGVFLEYPIVAKDDYNSLKYSFDVLEPDENNEEKTERIPTYEECINKYKVKPLSMIDLVIIDNEKPKYLIEICYSNPVSKYKIELLKRLGVKNLIEIDAIDILKQIKKPTRLNYRKLI